ncbi:diiron oxygenase [Burkholderia pseudomallei]|uniref:p-aminobenzoate N-oxygenase AurF family protein n=1 Tax=Burkholderia pseudomallei TaxID=28450 RepID=A0A7U5K4M5_BURPE|nr:diiron oxygenase [Burkholderia pseudomallei]APD39562.1 P-aminobenzoate N-oxygenase AurF family protein [Burkholderia pseudomallei]APY97478.1 P-aminobenzoate N-oxygenase AurF family protein [Burkholderia pseudomallei]APZ03560.1 P-aminobenzoate N-oxygenase AurF family protein [Burkholderia pseudomallei]APZ17143.1 P-aminobenzoate N-oxygenase AurF family protein [Burkholderia pseudomallei]ARK44714.1 P-aminobenzoate N-oxygenase AurF family protein [Burkholderia pseudomallei]
MIMDAYRSPFDDWHQAASVRSMPADAWLAGGAGAWIAPQAGGVLAGLPARDARRERAAGGLLIAHLSFTVALENTLISPVARDIAARALHADYDDGVVADALRVQCDEAYHALLAQELMTRVRAATGADKPRRTPGFLRHVERLAATLPGVDAPLLRFCAAVVAETLITHTLRDDWRDEGLQPDVRTFLRRHYLDEARHSAYFSRLLTLLWPQWPAGVRDALRPLWSGLIDAFLFADARIAAEALAAAGLTACEIDCAMSACGAPDAMQRRRAQSARQTLHALRAAGALEAGESAAIALGNA